MNQSQAPSPDILTTELTAGIDGVLAAYDHNADRLVDILLDIQDIVPRRYLPPAVVRYLSQKLNLPLSHLLDVITFYAALSDTPRGETIIQICDCLVCRVVKNKVLKDTFADLLGINPGEATADGKYWLEYTTCFGACDVAPAVKINGKVYGNLTSRQLVREVLKQYQ